MEEVVKIYQPMALRVKKPVKKIEETNKMFLFDFALWKKVASEKQRREKELLEKYPAFNVIYNWGIALLVIALFVSFVIWGLDIRTDRIAEDFAATALADYQAEQNAVAQAEADRVAAEKASEAYQMKIMGTAAAKAGYGIRNFVDKYGYSDRDFRTYTRCMCDRVDYLISQMSFREQDALTIADKAKLFEEVVSQEAQFLAYSDSNPVLNEYYNPMYEEIDTWIHEASKPWDVAYRFAELKEDGIWLVKEFNADGYARRVRY